MSKTKDYWFQNHPFDDEEELDLTGDERTIDDYDC